uniref:Uncharacterized protein n=1 Tax=Nelumbo nucifera TaxID=4432 RepID=A0A822Y3R9_NELNU|nr:TPA_asm: hypothetical protein HUJ06_027417 [Nelumbo nucifera]
MNIRASPLVSLSLQTLTLTLPSSSPPEQPPSSATSTIWQSIVEYRSLAIAPHRPPLVSPLSSLIFSSISHILRLRLNIVVAQATTIIDGNVSDSGQALVTATTVSFAAAQFPKALNPN